MKYKLSIRRIEESDLNVNSPYMPEEDDFEMYFSALIDDIKNIDVILNVTREADDLTIEIKEESDYTSMHSKIKELLKKQDYYTQLRSSSTLENEIEKA